MTTLERGRVVYVGTTACSAPPGPTRGSCSDSSRRKKFRRVIVDMRLNPGGDNHTYVDLLRALRRSRSTRRAGWSC